MAQNEQLAQASLPELCPLLLRGIVGWIRKHEGVLRATLQHANTRPDRWSTFRGLVRTSTAQSTAPLLRAMGRGREAAKARSIAFGFQVVLGTLANAILNNPGPLSLHDEELEIRLSGCLLLLLEAEMKPASKATVRAPGRRKK